MNRGKLKNRITELEAGLRASEAKVKTLKTAIGKARVNIAVVGVAVDDGFDFMPALKAGNVADAAELQAAYSVLVDVLDEVVKEKP